MPIAVEHLPILEAAPALTDWENPPSLVDLKQDYEDARSSHDAQVSRIQGWLNNLNVEGEAKIPKRKGRSSFVPKLIRKQAEWRYAALSEPFLSQLNLFKSEPRTHADKRAAYENVLVLNYQMNVEIDKVKFIDEYVRTAVDEGTVVVRVGWVFEEEEQDVELPVLELHPVQDPQQAQEMLMQGLPPLEEVQVGTRIERQMVTVTNAPTLEICNFNNVLIDPTCNGDLKKAAFVIYKFETSLSELEKAGIYSNLDRVDIESTSILNEPDTLDGSVSSFNFRDKPRKKFVAYEYWGYWDINGEGRTRPFVATWVGETFIRMEESPFPDKKLPFVVVQYLPKRQAIYGEPDGELLEDNQRVLGAVTRGMIDIMGRSAAGQKGTRVDALDVTNRRRFDQGEDYEFQAHVDPKQAFYDHNYPDIPRSAQFMIQMQQDEAEALTGVKSFSSGLSGDSLGKTATGAQGVMNASGKRELGILRRLAAGIKEIGYKIVAMNGEFLSDEEIIRISDEEFVSINRDNLKGRFDLKLDIASAEMDNIKAGELSFMLQTMGNSMPPAMSQMVLADIARLRTMHELAKRIEEYVPEPDPMQQQLQMLQMQKLQAEIAVLESEAMKNQADSQLNAGKFQSETAKARHLAALADKQDLDFVEEETGTNHARELQRQAAQAQAQSAMKEREADRKDYNTFLSNMMTQKESNV